MTALEPTPKQQLVELVKTSKSILVVTHANPDGDAIGSALALSLGLEKLGKQVTVLAEGELPEQLSFLPHFDRLKNQESPRKDLLLILDESQAKIGNVSLKRISETKLVVVITPKDGTLTSTNVRVEEGSYPYDLIIVLDCSNIERTGEVYNLHSSLFYETPVVNIDHHADNPNFGKINLVDLSASSTAEMLVSLLETLGKDTPGIIDADIATLLLTGITTDTGSFQNANTTPKALTVAAQLVAAGGRQQEIVKNIFRTRQLSTLRLWGRALSYIKEDTHNRFAWSSLTKADFVAAQANPDESSGVIDELMKSAQGVEFVFLLTERNGNVHGSFRSVNPTCDVSKIAHALGGGGHAKAAAFKIENAMIKDKEAEILKIVRSTLQGVSEQASEEIEASEAPKARVQPTAAPSHEPKMEVEIDTLPSDDIHPAKKLI